MFFRKLLCSVAAGFLCVSALAQATSADKKHLFFHVTLPKTAQPAHGRLLVMVTAADAAKKAAKDGNVTEVDASQEDPMQTWIAAKEVWYLAPGGTVDIDTDNIAFPGGFSKLPPGDYLAQVLLDVNHTYVYNGRNGGDLTSAVVLLHVDATMTDGPTMTLDATVPDMNDDSIWNGTKIPMPPEMKAARPHMDRVDFVSPSLSKFWGREVKIKSWVVRPPGYETSTETYPVVYFTHGFTADITRIIPYMALFYAGMASGKYPKMIIVGLDESLPSGTHEFADSVNNGPWGHALTTEYIPYIETKYRMDAKPEGRFLNGHSSGGWATLWLQTRYPKVFGGTWSTSPDPSDFTDFSEVDLYAPHANMYRKPDGSAYPIVRDHDKVLATAEQVAKQERVEGPVGGQNASFEWVFSPRGPDGRPMEIFNRDTGDIDPAVAKYWHDNYDISYLVTSNWPALKPDLDGKIHLFVGTADTFYLDGAAHKLQAKLDALGAKSYFTFIPNRTHFDLYGVGSDRRGLFKQIFWEMYAVARPGSKPPAS